jgi:hypothetical protein
VIAQICAHHGVVPILMGWEAEANGIVCWEVLMRFEDRPAEADKFSARFHSIRAFQGWMKEQLDVVRSSSGT